MQSFSGVLAQLARAIGSQSIGQGFDSPILHKNSRLRACCFWEYDTTHVTLSPETKKILHYVILREVYMPKNLLFGLLSVQNPTPKCRPIVLVEIVGPRNKCRLRQNRNLTPGCKVAANNACPFS